MYKINFEKPIHIHFIGIGGISMSGLAEILLEEGFTVSGSDSKESPLTKKLESEGAIIHYGQCAENISDGIDCVVYTAAINKANPELMEAVARKIPMLTRAELLGQLMKNYKTPIAVSGTHGKTTTTSMISHILLAADLDPTISVGGILKAIGGNIRVGKSETFITEACEYTNSFLHFYPKISVILNIEEDHLDFFKDLEDIRHSFHQFAALLPSDGTLIINGDIDNYQEIYEGLDCNVITYGSSDMLDYSAANITYDEKGLVAFDLIKNGKAVDHIQLSVTGDHNVSNALASIATAELLQIPMETIKKGILSFSGTDRRFEYKGTFNGVTVVDDYAHHPTAIRYVIEATRVRYPGKKIVAIFQPDRFSRGARFAKEFAQEMDKADYPYFCPFPENAKHEDGIDIDIYDISKNSARAKVITEDEAGVKELMQYDNCVFLFMSSKDIYKFEEMLIEAKKPI